MKNRNKNNTKEMTKYGKKINNRSFFESARDEFYYAHLLELLFEHGSADTVNNYHIITEKKKNIKLKK